MCVFICMHCVYICIYVCIHMGSKKANSGLQAKQFTTCKLHPGLETTTQFTWDSIALCKERKKALNECA